MGIAITHHGDFGRTDIIENISHNVWRTLQDVIRSYEPASGTSDHPLWPLLMIDTWGRLSRELATPMIVPLAQVGAAVVQDAQDTGSATSWYGTVLLSLAAGCSMTADGGELRFDG